jgi:exopolysaccharide biosynthesis WecB/TagA/CpsF family protein
MDTGPCRSDAATCYLRYVVSSRADVPATHTVDCLGVPVAQTNVASMTSWVFEAASERSARTVFFANAHTLNVASRDGEFRHILQTSDLVLNDGIGLNVYARLAGTAFEENMNGTDLLPSIFAAAAERDKQLTVFLFGAKPGHAEKAARTIEQRFPTTKVVGVQSGYDHSGVIEAIRAVSPDLLLVGMGNPLQEKWITAHQSELNAGVVFGIGALIDFLSGEIVRAPRLVRALRIEWIFRLAQEPRRLASRYLKGNPLFLVRAIAHIRRVKRSGALLTPPLRLADRDTPTSGSEK